MKIDLHIDSNMIWYYDAFVNLPLSELSATKAYSQESSFIHPPYIDCHATCFINSQYKIELSAIQSLVLLYHIKKREFYSDYYLDILKSLEVILEKWKDIRSIRQCTSNLLERKRHIINCLHGMELIIFDYFNLGKHIRYLKGYSSNQL